MQTIELKSLMVAFSVLVIVVFWTNMEKKKLNKKRKVTFEHGTYLDHI